MLVLFRSFRFTVLFDLTTVGSLSSLEDSNLIRLLAYSGVFTLFVFICGIRLLKELVDWSIGFLCRLTRLSLNGLFNRIGLPLNENSLLDWFEKFVNFGADVEITGLL
ncbi:unnamed protein product [Brachionus calyciflorus]|uniref:Uncharacterized protein n=1 Tax=Brachionus calyciflorus TaxID=104777 RepID=A0A813X3W6_9BILA|nr:unnamed protein product [Brachionus calyciflorus]